MKYAKLLLVGFVLALICGCAQFAAVGDFVKDNPFAVSIGTRQAVARYIDRGDSETDKNARASKVIYLGNKMLGYIDSNPTATVDQILAVTRTAIPWNEMSLPDQLLAQNILTLVEQDLRAKQTAGEIPRNALIFLRPLFETAISAAYWYL